MVLHCYNAITVLLHWQNYFPSLSAAYQQKFHSEFSAELEKAINTVLVAVQTLVKRKDGEQPREQQTDSKRGEESPLLSASNNTPGLYSLGTKWKKTDWNWEGHSELVHKETLV